MPLIKKQYNSVYTTDKKIINQSVYIADKETIKQCVFCW